MLRLGRVMLPAMGILLAAYVSVHSPLLRWIGRLLGREASRCYFSCSGWAPNGRPIDAVAALLCLVLAVGAAWVVATQLPERGAERILAAGLLTLAFSVVPASLIGVIGWATGATPLRPPVGPLLAGLPAAITVGIGWSRGWARPRRWPEWHRPGALVLVLGASALALLGASVVVSVFHPPTGYDALSYHAPLGVYFWRDGNIGMVLDQQIWGAALAHPGTMELWAGLLRLGGGEDVANLAQLPFALLGGVAVYVFSRRTGLTGSAAAIGGLAFLLAPMVIVQAGMQLNDLMACALMIIATALAAAPPAQWSVSRVALTGLALGLAVTTKLAMLPAAAAVAVYLTVLACRGRGVRGLVLAAASFAIVVAPWWLRNVALFGNPLYPAALPFIGRGLVPADFGPPADFVPGSAAWPLYPLLESHGPVSGLGALFLVGAIPGLLVALRWARRAPMVLYGLIVGVSLLAWWMLTGHDPRFLLHLFGLGFAFLGWTLMAVPRRRRPVAAVLLAVAGVFSALVTTDEAIRPLLRAPTERAEFYDRMWGVDSVASALPATEPLLSHTGYAKFSYAADYALLGPRVERTLISIDGPLATDSIIDIMRPRGIHYAYVPAAPEAHAQVSAMYSSEQFELFHSSVVTAPGREGIRRYLFRLRAPLERPTVTPRPPSPQGGERTRTW